MNPELSNKEFETRKTIISELEKMGVEYRLAAGTGLVAIIKVENRENIICSAAIWTLFR